MKYLGLILCLLLFYVPLALASIYYVDGSGAPADDSFTGLQATWTSASNGPLLTLTGAATKVSPPDSTWTRYSTYWEKLTIADANTAWFGCTAGTVAGWEDSLARPIINAQKGGYPVTWNVTTVSLVSFNIQSSNTHNIYGNTSSHGAWIDDCIIDDSPLDGVYLRGVGSTIQNSTVRKAGSYALQLSNAGITARWCTLTGSVQNGIYIENNNISILDSLIQNCGSGTAYYGAKIQVGTGISILRNRFVDCPLAGIYIYGTTSNSIVDSNIFTGAGPDNVYNLGHIIVANDTAYLLARNNVLYGRLKNAVTFTASTYAGRVQFYNNIIAFNELSAYGGATGNLTAGNNLVYGGTDNEVPAGCVGFANLTGLNPLIANVTTGELWSNSPCWGAGTDAAGFQADSDYNGNEWYDEGKYALPIGAYATPGRYTPTNTPTPTMTPTPSITPTPAATRTPTPTVTPSTTPTVTPTPSVTPSVTPTPQATRTPTPTPSTTPTPTPLTTRTPTPTPAGYLTPTPTPIGWGTPIPARTPVPTPSPVPTPPAVILKAILLPDQFRVILINKE